MGILRYWDIITIFQYLNITLFVGKSSDFVVYSHGFGTSFVTFKLV